MSALHIRWLNRTAILILVITLLAISLIASGVFDPTPSGPRLWQRELPRMSVPPDSRKINWLQEDVPESPFTVRMAGAHQSGEKDIGYGLVLGDDEGYLAVAVSPLGYLAIWETDGQDPISGDSYLLEWQTWPHVRTDGDSNEIWIDVAGDRAGVRVNREWLWEGRITKEAGNVGILGESFGEPAVIDFGAIELFSDTDE